jgi:hypothetical protein
VESGFEATYRFTIDNEAPLALWAVVERPDLYVMTCNGRAVQPAQGKWWIDRGFGMIDLSAVTRPGANEVHLLARPFTVFHEIAAIYILGDFRLKAGEAGFTIRADAPLTLGSWKEQGCPFYAHGVVYRQRFDVSAGPKRYLVELPQWLGSVAKVRVNGRLCGHIISRPWRADVTRQIRAGTNEIEVEAIGTLKNALGPFHGKLAEGNVWPQHFMAGPKQGPPPGIQYHTLGYGLFKPFLLRREVGQMERAAKP